MKRACVHGEPFEHLLIAAGFSDELQRGSILCDCIIRRDCRYCNVALDQGSFAIGFTYWRAMWEPYHAQCKERGMAENAFECQRIDADCNDCKHFKRGERIGATSFNGHCLKKNISAKAFVNFASGHDCFEHRKS